MIMSASMSLPDKTSAFFSCRLSFGTLGGPAREMGDSVGDVVRLNVGGHEYVTSKSTLQKVSDSMLARPLANMWGLNNRRGHRA